MECAVQWLTITAAFTDGGNVADTLFAFIRDRERASSILFIFREICSARSPLRRRASLSAKLVESNWKSSDIFPGFVEGEILRYTTYGARLARVVPREINRRDWIYFLSDLSGRLDVYNGMVISREFVRVLFRVFGTVYNVTFLIPY